MNKTISFILILLTIPFLLPAQESSKRNLLGNKYKKKQFPALIISQADWHPYPTIAERDEWKQIPEEMQNFYIYKAEIYHDHKWQILPVSVFLNFARNGNSVLTDISVSSFTAKTFNPNRSDIWTLQTSYHNLPLIKEYRQEAGGEFSSKNVPYRQMIQESFVL
jgi:hypothetical protein